MFEVFGLRRAQNGVMVDRSKCDGIFWNSFSDPFYLWVGCPFWKNGQATPYKRTSKGKSVKVWQIWPKLFLWSFLSLMEAFQLKKRSGVMFEVFGLGRPQNGVTVDRSTRDGFFWNLFCDPSYPWVECLFWKSGQLTPYKRTSKGKSVKAWWITLKLVFISQQKVSFA